MSAKLSFFILMVLGLFSKVSSQQLLNKWDSAFNANRITVTPLNQLNGSEGDYTPIMLNSGHLLFTSERVNPKTREMALSGNQNVYEYNPQTGKVSYSYFYNNDNHTAVAGISANAGTIFLFRAWDGGNIYFTSGLSGKERYNHFKALKSPVNNDDSQEQSAALWTQWLVFSSDRESGKGGFDLYYGMADEKMKLYGALLLEGVNSDSSETDARFMADGTLLFSSNRSGRFCAYSTRFDGVKWELPQPIAFIPDSFSGCDVRDLVVYDSVFYFSSNKNGNYDVYSGVLRSDTLVVPQPDTVILVIEDSVPVKIDTVVQINKFEQKLQDMEQKLDSMEYKPYKAFVQVGAYRFVQTIAEFKSRFAAFDTTALRIEYDIAEDAPTEKIQRFIIDKTYSTLRSAAIRQQDALKLQASAVNSFESPVDAFIAVYDNRNVRIVIFFNLDKDDYKILIGDKVVYF